MPRSVVVLGGGPIGCEFAQIFTRFGVPTTIVGRNERLLPKEDPDMSTAIKDILVREGITVYTGTEAKRVEVEGQDKIVIGVRGGEEIRVRAGIIIAAAGRKARIEHLSLENTGIKSSGRASPSRRHCKRASRISGQRATAPASTSSRMSRSIRGGSSRRISASRASARSRKRRTTASYRGRPSPIRKWRASA